MSADPKRGVAKFDENKITPTQPCATAKDASKDLQDKEQQHDVIELEPHERLTANQEQRLKKEQYNFQQPSHRHDPNPKNQHRAGGHGRDHGNLQLQERSQNH